MTVAELLARISSRELSEWMAYDALEAADMQQRELIDTAQAGLAGMQRGS